MTQIRIAIIIEILIVGRLPVVPVTAIPASRAQPHRTDAIVHVAIAEIPMARRRIGLHAEHSAEAVVPREDIDAVAVGRQRTEAIVGDAQAIAFAVLHVDVVLLALPFGVGPEGDANALGFWGGAGEQDEDQGRGDSNIEIHYICVELKRAVFMKTGYGDAPAFICSLAIEIPIACVFYDK